MTLLALPDTLDAISDEVMRARLKFPGNRFLLAALVEEVGELAKAMLQNEGKERIEREAIQVAAVAVRILEEGDATFADITAAESKVAAELRGAPHASETRFAFWLDATKKQGGCSVDTFHFLSLFCDDACFTAEMRRAHSEAVEFLEAQLCQHHNCISRGTPIDGGTIVMTVEFDATELPNLLDSGSRCLDCGRHYSAERGWYWKEIGA